MTQTRATVGAIVSLVLSSAALDAQTVGGVVRFGATSVPVAGVTALLLDPDFEPVDSVETDAEGRFLLRARARGEHTVLVRLPRGTVPTGVIALEPGRHVSRDITVDRSLLGGGGSATALEQALRRSVGEACGPEHDVVLDAVLVGQIVDGASEAGRSGAAVHVQADDGWAVDISAEDDGTFVVCGLDPGRRMTFWASRGADETDALPLAAWPGGVHTVTLALDADLVRGEAGVLAGRIQDGVTAQPVTAAVVRLAGTGYATLSDEQGRFRFSEVRPGEHTLVVEHLSYGESRKRVTMGGAGGEVQIRLAPRPLDVDGIAVTVSAPAFLRDMRDVQHRMDLGLGHFVMADEIRMRGATRLSQALLSVPGVRVRRSGPHSSTVTFRRTPGCGAPQVFLNGRLYRLDPGIGFEEALPHDVIAIEVYKSAAGLPGEFHYGGQTRCGAIAIWTRR